MSRARTVATRVIPLVLVIGLGAFLVGRDAPAAVTLRFVAAGEVTAIDASLRRGGEEVGHFRADAVRARPGGELGRWPLTARAGAYTVVVTLTRPSGPPVEVTRAIELTDEATITIDVTAERR